MRKVKPCDFCEEDWSTDYKEGRNGFCLWADIYPFGAYITVTAQANDEEGEMLEDSIQIPMNFCPSCGRKLNG